MKQIFLSCLFCCLSFAGVLAQDAAPTIARYLLENKEKWRLNAEEATNNWIISDQYLSAKTQVTHVYVQQTIHGLKLHNAVSAAAIKNGAVVIFNSRFTPGAAGMVNALPGSQQLSEQDAVLRAAEGVQVAISDVKMVEAARPDKPISTFTAAGSVEKPIKVFPVYHKMTDQIRLAWNVEIKSKSDWWSIRVDAMTGQVLEKSNYTVYCNFSNDAFTHRHDDRCITTREMPVAPNAPETLNAAASYKVFPFPGESPNHIAHQLVTDPFDLQASPYGWHDTDGAEGAEYTITRGNNVNAAEDRDDNDTLGYSPDGGAALLFDFPYLPAQEPEVWQDAAITNLFYANNIMHDVTYRYGFDEAAGNFQENNYSRGGEGGDAVQADAQDGSGTNNANFSTPPDGESGRMQMYVWTVASSDSIAIHSPESIAGGYYAPRAAFGPEVTSTLTGELVLIQDDTDPFTDGCGQILNAAAISGKIALIDRGSCSFAIKVKAAQDAGAIGVIVCNNEAGAPFSMSGNNPAITIPSSMISLTACQAIKAALANGPVNMSFKPSGGNPDHDSDVDNGIIAHEYGHGISNRLTGGPSNTSCLFNEEQMGEGWSDWYALITTMHATDDRFTPRPVGTYSFGEPTDGQGIRNQLYSTDMSVCTYTYDDLPGTQGETHNIGELWTAMIWDLTWDLIDQYGYDPDLFNGTGGNNIALHLVTEGMKLQACSPGFADGRDGILAADQLLYNGANQCLIWAAFARRGLGFSADQGSSFDFTDGTGAFDLPPVCQIAVLAPVAGFTVDRNSSCLELATFKFADQSQNIAQYYLWDFGDGITSTEANPVHQYEVPGSYTVSLVVTNNIGADTLIQSDLITVTVLEVPAVASATVCAGNTTSLTAVLGIAGNTAEWRDSTGNIVFTGTTFETPALLNTTTFQVNEAENVPVQQVGPAGPGTGGNHNTSFIAQTFFTAEKAFSIKSALVRAQGAGNRDIRLIDVSTGSILQSVTVNVPAGQSRIPLNLTVPAIGEYALEAGPMVNLYRDNAGVVYPFDISGLVTITGSNAGQDGFYYYFYDWEVQEVPCRSAEVPVTVTVTPGPLANFSIELANTTATFSDLSTGSPSSWAWDFGDGTTSDQPSPAHTYASAGVYIVTLTVSDGSCSHVFTQTVDFSTGTNTLNQDLFDVQLSPNPATGQTNLTLTGTPGGRFVNISLYSTDGRLVQQNRYDSLQGAVVRLGLENMASGMYLVKIGAENGVVVKKLTVQ
ncbi:MAG: T9SS-dependent M36 family metallopeptidase [Saprospiraceae bacterium]|nr:T9SS-dependent M36 family metallopeptidase [Saprospiraceae bacterium]